MPHLEISRLQTPSARMNSTEHRYASTSDLCKKKSQTVEINQVIAISGGRRCA